MPSICLAASNLTALQGKPAPELQGVVGWYGKPVTFCPTSGQIRSGGLLGILVWSVRAGHADTHRFA